MAKYPPGTIFYLTTVKKCEKHNPVAHREYLLGKKLFGTSWRTFKRNRHCVIQQFPIDKK